MKKILAVVFSLGLLSTAFAQGGYPRSGDYGYGRPNNPVYKDRYDRNGGYFSARERDALITRINREFNFRILAVRHNRYMRNAEKRRQIRSLEIRRAQEIRDVNLRFSRQRSNRDYDRNGRYDRNDRRW